MLLGFKHKQLPPSLHHEQLNEHIKLEDSPFYINTALKAWETDHNTLRRAAINSFGFSGTNAHLVVEEYIPPEKPAYYKPGSALIPLSAKNEDCLKEQVEQLKNFLDQNPQVNLFDIAYTLQTGRAELENRLALVSEDLESLHWQLDSFLLEQPGTYFQGIMQR